MNISNELATCIAKIKSWDVFPDQEASRNEVLATLNRYLVCECPQHSKGSHVNSDPNYRCLDCGKMVPTL